MIAEIRPTNASLSTMWAIKNYPDLNDFFQISKKMGFEKVELNHQVDSAMLSLVNFDHLQISSIHEPCPADIPTKQLVDRDWLISSHIEPNRQQGITAVRQSILLAHRLGAPVVVVHCGSIRTNTKLEPELRMLFDAGRSQSDEYLETQAQFIQSRENQAAIPLEAVKKSLIELLEVAELYNVKLGLENRYHYLDIPSVDEMGELLSLADDSRLGFIYDVGHAQALDRLGFYAHKDWLKRFAGRMFGIHLHDVLGVADHKAPGLGDVDFTSIASFIPENAFRTIEVQPGNTLAQLKQGLQLLVEAGCIKYL